MFKFARERVVSWPVTLSVPQDGGPQKVEVRVRYRLMTRSEMDTVVRRLREQADDGSPLAVGDTIDALLEERIVGWGGIEGESGELLEFNAENLKAMLDVPFLREAFESGLYQASRGALAKN